MLQAVFHLFRRPGLVREHTAFHDPGFGSGTEKETRRMGKNGVRRVIALRLPDPFEIGKPFGRALRAVGRGLTAHI